MVENQVGTVETFRWRCRPRCGPGARRFREMDRSPPALSRQRAVRL